ncbi:ATP-grasp domain-containing protein (plasmid) [Streptomyces sp. Q6]|uniref:ATP-grasp domain-containing protein n=1 Tax=Streptomyces citrinus TaxID=3118173 RepID=A0ACD5AQX9_9ACTN
MSETGIIPPKRIVVTGVGAAPGFDLARHLQRLQHHVICTDAQPLAPGLLLPRVTARVTPRADHPAYAAAMVQLCRQLRPDALMVGIENDLLPLLEIREDLARVGVRLWLPDAASVEACLDKAAFHEVLVKAGVPTARTVLPEQLDEVPEGEGALVVKPRRGHGAQHVHICSTHEQARVLCELVPEPMIQERLLGYEFTADCLVDRTGRAAAVLRYRALVKSGLSMVSTTFHDEQVDAVVRQTLAAAGAMGLCCVQGFVDDAHPQRVRITELNVRIAGGFALAEAAGAELIGQSLNAMFGRHVDHSRLAYRPGIFLTKYVETLASGDQTLLPALSEVC